MASAPAAAPALVLFTRQGCCLCEGLQERLLALGFRCEEPAPDLALIDVDDDPGLQARYGLQVPVLARRDAAGALRELPRVPPRLAGERLAQWLAQQGVQQQVP